MGPSVMHSVSSHAWGLWSVFCLQPQEKEKGIISQANYPLENYILKEKKAEELLVFYTLSFWWRVLLENTFDSTGKIQSQESTNDKDSE